MDTNSETPEDGSTRRGEGTSYFRPTFRGDTPGPEPSAADGDLEAIEARIPAGSALLVISRGPKSGARFLVEAETTSAGRHPDSDIVLDDVTVSRHHAEIRRGEGEFVVRDLDSLNGTYVNRHPVSEAALANGDEIQIGKFRLVFLTAS